MNTAEQECVEQQTIKAVFFDIGGTLVEKNQKPKRDMALVRQMSILLGNGYDIDRLILQIDAGEKEYKRWRNQTLIELPIEERWSRFFLKGLPQELVREHAMKLQELWSTSRGIKWAKPSTEMVLKKLTSRGYTLATISHTSPKHLVSAGLGDLFCTMIHAPEFGYRKPHPSLFLEAARRCGFSAAECAYVGDRPSRDVIGPREAGMGMVIIMRHFGVQDDPGNCPMKPDAWIDELSDLLDVFPEIKGTRSPGLGQTKYSTNPPILYDVALSSMWWDRSAVSINDCFLVARMLGIARFELNHQTPPEAFNAIDYDRFVIGSTHDPCPAEIPAKQLEREDVQITSLDEKRRQEGIDVVKRTIDKAQSLGARHVVIHPGRIICDHAMDDELRAMYRRGEQHTQEFIELRKRMVTDRAGKAAPHLEQLLKSLAVLIEYSKDAGLRLGFENRFHYYELPIENELEVILREFQQPWVGWQLDIGHARVLDELGVFSFTRALEKFGNRIVGVHLHDVIGIQDHRVPGSGEVDFSMVAANLPVDAYRTIEIDKSIRPEALADGLKLLHKTGCINLI